MANDGRSTRERDAQRRSGPRDKQDDDSNFRRALIGLGLAAAGAGAAIFFARKAGESSSDDGVTISDAPDHVLRNKDFARAGNSESGRALVGKTGTIGIAIDNLVDTVKAHTFLGTDRPHALRQMITACRKGGRVSIPGVYGGFVDKFPLGALMEKGLTVKSGQTHMQKWMKPLLELIQEGTIDTTWLISHRAPLEQAAEMYRHWHDEQNEYTKIVLKPGMALNRTSQPSAAMASV